MGGRGAQSGLGSNFSSSQESAIEEYVSGNGMWINQYFRKDGDGFSILSADEKKYVKELDKVTDKKLKEQTLYRSVDASAIFGNMSESEFEDLQGYLTYNVKNRYTEGAYSKASNSLNKTITEKGFMSTTKSESVASGWNGFTGSSKPIVMKIKTSKNTRGRDVSKIGDRYGDMQKETLLARNQKYKAKKIYSKNGSIYVDVNME